MTPTVVDASVVAKWFFPEEHAEASLRLIFARRRLLAPDLVWSEVGNIAWKRVQRGELTVDEAQALVDDLLRMPLEITPSPSLLPGAMEIALATGRTVNASLYVTLAVTRKCRLVTADERLVNALASTPLAKHVRHVGRTR